jgi:phosphoglycerate dehydrogenase-like enzyme
MVSVRLRREIQPHKYLQILGALVSRFILQEKGAQQVEELTQKRKPSPNHRTRPRNRGRAPFQAQVLAHLDALPSLRAVFYAAGSVQSFARPLLERGVTVVSSWAANAVPVAEWTLAQILLANKGYWRNLAGASSPLTRTGAFVGAGNFGTAVSLLGAGQIGRRVAEFLRPFALRVQVFDLFLAREDAARMNVEQVSLEEAFAAGSVVSNHLANTADAGDHGLRGLQLCFE